MSDAGAPGALNAAGRIRSDELPVGRLRQGAGPVRPARRGAASAPYVAG